MSPHQNRQLLSEAGLEFGELESMKTTKQRLIALGLTPMRVEYEDTGDFRGMAIYHNGEPIHGTLTAHVDYAIDVCNLLESGYVLANDIERCTGKGCYYRGDCKRFLAGLIDPGIMPFGDPGDVECEKMIPTDSHFCDTHCSWSSHHKDCVIGR